MAIIFSLLQVGNPPPPTCTGSDPAPGTLKPKSSNSGLTISVFGKHKAAPVISNPEPKQLLPFYHPPNSGRYDPIALGVAVIYLLLPQWHLS